jgi:hypothetical protein
MALAAVGALAGNLAAQTIRGDYLECRNANVWVGDCFVNGELHIVGDKAILAWKVTEGVYQDVNLDGLAVVAVVFGDKTFGTGHKVETQAIVLTDERASQTQQHALVELARSLAGETIQTVRAVRPTKITLRTDSTEGHGVAYLNAGDVKIRARCLADTDKTCGHERIKYPVLAKVESEYAAYTITSGYSGKDLGANFREDNTLSTIMAKFSR